ncbi:MAG: mechanosensitive ion channel [Verrucomicrobiota bacterium]|nr:mechanosensitive ion channel [Verrucomicrobiota bacterium]
MTGGEFFSPDRLAAGGAAAWPERLHRLGEQLAPLAGDWINDPTVAGITMLQWLLGAAILILTVLVVEILRRLARWKIKKTSRAEAAAAIPGQPVPQPSWLRLSLQEAGPPAIFFIWLLGACAAFGLLLSALPLAGMVLNWLARSAGVIGLFWFLFRMVNVVELQLNHWASQTPQKWDDVLAAVIVRAARLVVPLAGVLFIAPALPLPAASHLLLQQGLSLLLTGGVGYILYDLLATMEKAVIAQYRMDVRDNLAMRKIQTQVRVLKKIGTGVILIVTLALMLMDLPPVRHLGASLLASAGVAGIIIGFAAQRTLATFVAGIQIAFTQPIRLDDVVIVEGEWGRIEEITLTYVVVLIWDLRRLVVPITYFIEKPFQNWTRISADLLGTVFLYMDYTAPVDAVRAELDRILEHSRLWDRKVKGVQVTDSKEHTLEVRVLVSAANSSAAWDLRCEVREKLVDFLQRNYPHSLPRARAELAVREEQSPEPPRGNSPRRGTH